MNVDFMLLGHGLSTHQEFRSQRRRRIRDISHENEKQGGVITTPQETMECFLHRSRTQFAIHDDQRESGLKNNTQLLLCKKSARYQAMNISLPRLNESGFNDIGDPTSSESECSDWPSDNDNVRFEAALTSYELWRMRKKHSMSDISSDSGDDDGNPHNDWPIRPRRRTQRKTVQPPPIPGLVISASSPLHGIIKPANCNVMEADTMNNTQSKKTYHQEGLQCIEQCERGVQTDDNGSIPTRPQEMAKPSVSISTEQIPKTHLISSSKEHNNRKKEERLDYKATLQMNGDGDFLQVGDPITNFEAEICRVQGTNQIGHHVGMPVDKIDEKGKNVEALMVSTLQDCVAKDSSGEEIKKVITSNNIVPPLPSAFSQDTVEAEDSLRRARQLLEEVEKELKPRRPRRQCQRPQYRRKQIFK